MSRRHALLNARRWAAVRRQAFERDGWRCTACGMAGRLEGHHEPPLRRGADPYELAGIKTLCRDCHIKRHRPDDMVSGRMAWHDAVAELVTKSSQGQP